MATELLPTIADVGIGAAEFVAVTFEETTLIFSGLTLTFASAKASVETNKNPSKNLIICHLCDYPFERLHLLFQGLHVLALAFLD